MVAGYDDVDDGNGAGVDDYDYTECTGDDRDDVGDDNDDTVTWFELGCN